MMTTAKLNSAEKVINDICLKATDIRFAKSDDLAQNAINEIRSFLEKLIPKHDQQMALESILVDGHAYLVPISIAGELLDLNLQIISMQNALKSIAKDPSTAQRVARMHLANIRGVIKQDSTNE